MLVNPKCWLINIDVNIRIVAMKNIVAPGLSIDSDSLGILIGRYF